MTNKFLEQGKKSRFAKSVDTIVVEGKEFRKVTKTGDPNFGKYAFRTSTATGKRDSKGRIKSLEKVLFLTEDQLKKKVADPQTGKSPFKTYSKGYLADLEDIRTFVDKKGGAGKLYLSDIVEEFGDFTKEVGEGDQIRAPNLEKKILSALGEKEYNKLIKGGDRLKTARQRTTEFNKLVRAVNRGDSPLINLSSDKTNIQPSHFTKYLGPVEKKMYKKLSPKFKAVISRVSVPRKIYNEKDIKNISETTTKTFRKMEKKYPVSVAARTDILKAGTRSYNDKSYIIAQLARHVGEGGDKYKHISGDTVATAKFRNLKTGKLITLHNIDTNDPEFKRAADVYNDFEKINKTKIDNPLKKGTKITIKDALRSGGDYLVRDHLDIEGVKGEPLKNLAISTQKANMAGQITNLTEAEIKAVGRGLDLSVEDNIKRYTNYGQKLLKQSTDPDFKLLRPSEVIIKKEGTLKGLPAELKTSPIKKVESGYNDFVLNTVKKMRQDADLNVDGFCDWMGYARGGLATGGCRKQLELALEENPEGTFQQLANKTKNNKFRTAARQILSKIPKGGKLGAIIAGLGAVGLGTYAMTGDAEADESRITDQTMKYNSTTGTFDNTETGDPEDQEGILNWIADNPVKSGFAALPAFMGLGYGLSAAGMKRAGAHLMGWQAVIPAMMIPEKMHQWKTGMEAGEMITDPVNALWALGIRGPESLKAAEAYYANMLKQGQRGLDMTTLKSLKNVQGWKNLPGAMRTALMSPAATGTDLAFQKRLKPALKKLTESVIGSPGAKQAAKQGLGALAKRVGIGIGAAALLPATVAAGLVSAPLTLGLGALSFGYAQYKDYRDGKAIVDAMRAKGQISEEDAGNYMSLIKQGSLPFGLGNRLFGDDEMTIRGQTLNPEQQRGLLSGMEDQIDLFQEGRKEVRALDRADDFSFSEGGRVGMKLGGMDRRGFLKWLAGLGAAVIGGASGLFKTGAKKGIEQVVKQAPRQFVGVEGMPAWFPRAVQKIKTHGKLIEMADKHYVNGDIYEMIIKTKVPKMEIVAGKETMSGFKIVDKKVLLEDNPINGEIEISWNVDDFDGTMKRQINFKPGESGFQKFGADPEHPGAWEYQRVKVEEPEFTYGNPDQSTPERADFDYKDIFEEGDEVVKGLEDLTGNKKMVAQDGSVIETTDAPDVDEAFQKKIFKDIEGEGAMIPDPEGHMTPDGWSGDKGNPIIGGDIPTDILKKKARGGTVETGDIARRQSLVPPLAGPDPQGIMGLYSAPKQVRVG